MWSSKPRDRRGGQAPPAVKVMGRSRARQPHEADAGRVHRFTPGQAQERRRPSQVSFPCTASFLRYRIHRLIRVRPTWYIALNSSSDGAPTYLLDVSLQQRCGSIFGQPPFDNMRLPPHLATNYYEHGTDSVGTGCGCATMCYHGSSIICQMVGVSNETARTSISASRRMTMAGGVCCTLALCLLWAQGHGHGHA